VIKPQDAKRAARFSAIAPGILVAATGVGAGDLLTASLGGSVVGLSLLWAAGAGAAPKWFVNEGIARWQMATRTKLLEGWVTQIIRASMAAGARIGHRLHVNRYVAQVMSELRRGIVQRLLC
jgi:Mn2+/Fe2+ NRAMP family transporter